MSQPIKNPETPYPETPSLNDRDILSDALSMEKYLCHSYETAMHEASHDNLYQIIFSQLRNTSKQQRSFYDLHFTHGWYVLTPADSQEIQQVVQQFKDDKQQQLQ
ncbi:spore coat protein [Paenisporosarcina sp. TG20]|uniref:spore coat protein n=1 Tax=Paenisporosarcina sp. TG20 TaxID=1211706 RepID=UPI0002E14F05